MALLKFLRGTQAGLATQTIVDGALYFTTDSHKIYMGTASGLQEYSAIEVATSISALPTVADAIQGKFYYAEAENVFCFAHNGTWQQVNPDTGATSIEVVGEGNAVTAAAYDATTRKITLTKGETFATQVAVDNLATYVGTLPEGTTATSVVDYVNVKTAGIATDAALEELNGQVAGLQTAVQGITADYLKGEDKTELEGKITAAQTAADNAQGAVNTLTQTHATDKKALEDAIALKTNTADVYTKDDIDGKVNTINGAIADKADASSVYTKTEMDNKVAALEGADLAINNKIGTVADGKTVVKMIEEAQAAATYDDEEVRGLIGANTQAIAAEATARGELKTDLEEKINAKVAKSDYDTQVAALESEDGRLAGLISAMDEAYKAADNGLSGRIAALESDITGLAGAMHFKGVVDALPESTEGYNDGDTVICGNKEYVVNGEGFVELGDVSAEVQRISDLEAVVNGTGEGEAHVDGLVDKVADNATAIANEKARAEAKEAELVKADTDNLQAAKDYADAAVEALSIGDYAKQADLDNATGRITTAEGKITALETASATHALKTDVEAVSKELGDYKTAHEGDYTNAQVDAAIKVVADDLKAYEEAHASDYTNEEINNAIANAGHASATDLATHTGNADIHVTTDDKEKWNKAQENAEATAAAALATARTEISKEIDDDVLVEANRAKGIEEGLQTAIDAINNADTGILAQATTKANTAESNAKSYSDEKLAEALQWGEF